MNNAFRDFVPKFKRRNNSDPPWYRKKSHKRFIKFGGYRYRSVFEHLRREYQFLHRVFYRNYLWSIEDDLKSNSKQFWVNVNRIRKSSAFPNEMVYNNITSRDWPSSVDLFADFFSSVYNVGVNLFNSTFADVNPRTDVGAISISELDIYTAIMSLDNSLALIPTISAPHFLNNIVIL